FGGRVFGQGNGPQSHGFREKRVGVMKAWFNAPLTIWDISLPFSPIDFLLRFVLPVAGFLLAALVIKIIMRQIMKKFVKDPERGRAIIRWTRRIVGMLIVIGILLAGGALLGAEVFRALKKFLQFLNTPFFTSGNTSISVVTLILIVPIITLSSWAGRLVASGLEARSLKRFGLDAEQAFSTGRLLRYLVMVLVFIIGMSIIGINLSAIGVIFGVMGIGIGFGLQSLIADFFAGITLISMGLVKEGDRIRSGEYDGIIQRIRLINTEMNTFENETLIIPNRLLTGGTIHNYSYKDRRVIIKNEVDVSYGSNLDQVIEIMEEVASRNPWLDTRSEIVVWVVSFAESGITMQLRTWIKDVSFRAAAASWTNLEIWRSFAAAGVEIPFPQRVVHMASASSKESQNSSAGEDHEIRAVRNPSVVDSSDSEAD
ncbi:MAG: mechanosensitive ion channel, partial [Spirochaetaceae bacterium]|nr:mechanosensitive ion channel [Spirochaetaceae bacterium]